ncbi:MAG: hypothetical protein M1828_006169 [Chrysothrix sp. TS-e1954]|nr:MAG: hypothetical protein M1828_006169 [Chrysothrix sp. TS-e1954]
MPRPSSQGSQMASQQKFAAVGHACLFNDPTTANPSFIYPQKVLDLVEDRRAHKAPLLPDGICEIFIKHGVHHRLALRLIHRKINMNMHDTKAGQEKGHEGLINDLVDVAPNRKRALLEDTPKWYDACARRGGPWVPSAWFFTGHGTTPPKVVAYEYTARRTYWDLEDEIEKPSIQAFLNELCDFLTKNGLRQKYGVCQRTGIMENQSIALVEKWDTEAFGAGVEKTTTKLKDLPSDKVEIQWRFVKSITGRRRFPVCEAVTTLEELRSSAANLAIPRNQGAVAGLRRFDDDQHI